MATADIEEYLSDRDWGHKLFSMQHCGQLAMKVVGINGVVQKFIDSATISEAEKKSLAVKVADKKFRHLLTIITNHCNGNDLGALKTFIDILGDTNNVAMGQHLSLIYDERVNYFATLRLLSKEKSLVKNLENEISRWQRILDEQKECLETLTAEKNELVIQNETFKEENLSLEKQKKKIEKKLLFVEEEMGKLTRNKNNLENVIRERGKQIVEKEREVWEAIEERDRLRIEIDTLKEQQSKAMVEDREMSKKIEELEDKIGEKENIIVDLRQNQTMTRKDVEEEFGNLMKVHAKQHDYQMAMIKKQNDEQTAMIKKQNDEQTAMLKKQNDDQKAMLEKQNDDQKAMIKKENDDQKAMLEKQNDDQKAMQKKQEENMNAIMRALKLLEKK